MKSKDIEELEHLAKQFIIGHEELTERENELLLNIAAMESQLSILDRKRSRIKIAISAMYHALQMERDKIRREALA